MSDVGTQLFRQIEARGMGGGLAGLSHAARCVLIVMSINALDRGNEATPAATYFRGWEHLARAALGRTRYDAAAERAVARAISELVDAGLVKVHGRRHGSRHAPAMYEITP